MFWCERTMPSLRIGHFSNQSMGFILYYILDPHASESCIFVTILTASFFILHTIWRRLRHVVRPTPHFPHRKDSPNLSRVSSTTLTIPIPLPLISWFHSPILQGSRIESQWCAPFPTYSRNPRVGCLPRRRYPSANKYSCTCTPTSKRPNQREGHPRCRWKS